MYNEEHKLIHINIMRKMAKNMTHFSVQKTFQRLKK